MARYRGTMAQQVLRLPLFSPGMPARERLLARLSPAATAWMQSTLLSTEWYDEALAVELSNAVAHVLNLETDEAIQTFFRRQHMQAYTSMLRQQGIRSPDALFATLPTLWTRQHDTGSMRITRPAKLSATISIRDNAAALDRVHSLALQGGTEGLLTLAGALGVRSTRVAPRTEAAFAFTWEALATGDDEG